MKAKCANIVDMSFTGQKGMDTDVCAIKQNHMNKHQFRVLRNTLKREQYVYYKEIYDLPFTRKKILDLRFNNKKPYYIGLQYQLTKGPNVYGLYSIYFTKDQSKTLYIITKNDIIIYWISSNIFAPASAAWHLITEVYHGYKPHNSSWQWKSVDEFDCVDIFLSKDISFIKNHFVKYMSEYQLNMFNKTQKFYIDRCFITHEEANQLAQKEYHHV